MSVAIIWDFDGTLVDTRAKNYAVACRIVTEYLGRPACSLPALTSVEAFEAAYRRVRNWRELYTHAFGFDEQVVDELGAKWTPYQLADPTPVAPFEGIPDVLAGLGTRPLGIVSQNARANIRRMLREWGLDGHFELVVGYEEVASHRQKPAPDGLLHCIEHLVGAGPATVLYVGDHEADAECAVNAAATLMERGLPVTVHAVAACFADLDRPQRWRHPPHFTATHPTEVMDIVNRIERRAP